MSPGPVSARPTAYFAPLQQPMTVSGTEARASGMVEKLARGLRVNKKAYY
jgi:hypothetical protein